jgi:hypothetical protein
MAKYLLTLRDDQWATEDRLIDITDIDDWSEVLDTAKEAADDWCAGGSWDSAGASVTVYWEIKLGGATLHDGSCSVEIEPDHAELIRRVMGSYGCGLDPDDHKWTSEGEEGCDENPGVWSLGGTRMQFRDHCRACGLTRVEVDPGSQRNPGESKSIDYSYDE